MKRGRPGAAASGIDQHRTLGRLDQAEGGVVAKVLWIALGCRTLDCLARRDNSMRFQDISTD